MNSTDIPAIVQSEKYAKDFLTRNSTYMCYGLLRSSIKPRDTAVHRIDDPLHHRSGPPARIVSFAIQAVLNLSGKLLTLAN